MSGRYEYWVTAVINPDGAVEPSAGSADKPVVLTWTDSEPLYRWTLYARRPRGLWRFRRGRLKR